MLKSISSTQNPLVKKIFNIQRKSRERRTTGLFVVEGIREITLAIQGNYQIEQILFCKEIISEENLFNHLNSGILHSKVISITLEVYDKLAYRSSTEGVIALIKSKNTDIKNLQFKNDNPLLLVAEAPEKPGNIGALLRTADAANVDAVIIANPRTDLYNPNIIRNSVGCLFTNTVATGTTEEIISFLKENNIAVFCAALQASVPYHQTDFTQPSAIVVGTEAEGLSAQWLENSTQNIIIPMSGQIDSMNVSVAAGILIFEAKRQRGF